MEEARTNGSMHGRKGLLYPVLVLAAVAVIVFSAFAMAIVSGLL